MNNPTSPRDLGDCAFDVAVVGGGVVGCAAAVALARAGRRVALIERDWKEPDRIVGELMQPGGIEALRRLGLEDTTDGIDAQPVDGYAVVSPDGRDVVLPYATIQCAKTVLPEGTKPTDIAGKSFHHGRFVDRLRQAALAESQRSALVCICGAARDLVWDSSGAVCGVSVADRGSDSPATVRASLTVAADGCFSRFRSAVAQDARPEVASHFVGLVLRDCVLPHPRHGHVVLARPSPVLLYQIGARETRILVDIPGATLPSQTELRERLRRDVLPQLPACVRPSFLEALDDPDQRLRAMPNGWLPPVRNHVRGLVLVGDAHNMRHPLTGGGMTVGLWDAVRLVEHLPPQLAPEDVLDSLQLFYVERRRLAAVVNILAQALYQLFAAGDDSRLVALQNGCFTSFTYGGHWQSTPVALLAGVLHSPFTLVWHFFTVAGVAVSVAVRQRVDEARRALLGDSSKAAFPFLAAPLIALYLLPVSLFLTVAIFARAIGVIGRVMFIELTS